MIIEINYTALQYDNYQGGSGKPINGRILHTIELNISVHDLMYIAEKRLELEADKTKTIIGNYLLKNIIIDK